MKQTIITEYPAYLLIFTLLLAAAYSFFLYWRDKKLKEISKTKLAVMAGLRFLSVFIIASLLLSPMIKSLKINIEEPIIVFAQDNSESIAIAETPESLEEYQSLVNEFLSKTNKKFAVEKYQFGASNTQDLTFDFSDKYTDISKLITSISDNYFNRNIGALIIASDGIYNQGINPAYATGQSQFPIYTLALGDTTSYKDLVLSEVIHNKIAFKGNKFPVEIMVEAKKLKGKKTVLNISKSGQAIHSKEIFIDNPDYFSKFSFEIEAKESGVQQYAVSLQIVDDEKNTKNNSKIFAIDVIDSRQKILILGNSPHPDISALRSAIETNQNYEVEVAMANKMPATIKNYNLIILHQLPSAKNNLSKLLSDILNEKIPIIFVFGSQSSFDNFNKMNYGLLINKLGNNNDETTISSNDDFNLFELNEDFLKTAKKFPPLISPFGEYNVSPATNVLFYQKIKSIPTNKPMFAFNSENIDNETKTGFIVGEGIWRWRIHDYMQNQSTELFDELINQIVQYVSLKINKDRFVVNTNNVVNEGTSINFTAEVYNKTYELVNNEDVTMNIANSEGEVFSYTFSKNNNAYYLDAGNLPVGSYTFVAKTLIDNKEVTKSGSFTVNEINIEAEKTIANHQILNKLATDNGGKMYDKNQLDELLQDLNNNENINPISFSNKELTDFITFKWLFFLILALLSLEWFLRKFFGTY